MKKSFNLEPKDIPALQEELFRWQIYNFGEQDDRRMVLGICEESGELCHSQLKLEQGIRGTSDEHMAKMRDSIGDICIYALNLLSNRKESAPGIGARKDVEKTNDIERIGDVVLGVICVAAKIETARKMKAMNRPPQAPTVTKETTPIVRHTQELFMHLNMLCGLLGWNLENVIRETWATVGQRDWKHYPKTGLNPKTERSQSELSESSDTVGDGPEGNTESKDGGDGSTES